MVDRSDGSSAARAGRPRSIQGDTRVAYLNGRALNVVGGNGSDREAFAASSRSRPLPGVPTPSSWPSRRSTAGSSLVDTETARTVWRTVPVRSRSSSFGSRTASGCSLWRPVLRGARRERAQALAQAPGRPPGRRLRSREPPLRDGALLAGHRPERSRCFCRRRSTRGGALPLFGSRGTWLARDVAEREVVFVGWVNADQWLFLRLTAAKVQAVSNISRQFGVDTAGKPIASISDKRQLVLSRIPLILVAAVAALGSDGPVPSADEPIQWRGSRHLGVPWDGRLVSVQLPAEGGHYFTWDPVRKRSPNRPWRRWGSDRLPPPAVPSARRVRGRSSGGRPRRDR